MSCVRFLKMLALPPRGLTIVIESPIEISVLYPLLSSWVTLANLFSFSKLWFLPSVTWGFTHLTNNSQIHYFLFQALLILVPGNTTVNTMEKNPCLYLIHILDKDIKQERKEWKKKERKKKNRKAYNMSNSISYSYAIEKNKWDR